MRTFNLKRHLTGCLFLSFMLGSVSTHAEEQNQVDEKKELKTLSHAFGHFIGKNLKNPGITFDLEMVIQGIREGAAGKPAPISDEEYQGLLMKYQGKAFIEISKKNLEAAEEFLANNAKSSDVKVIEPGKLQYQIMEKGHGEAVKENSTPRIHYSGKFLDGEEFGNSEQTGGPITVPLDQTIPGFRQGLVGMLQGEKRKIFVHPDLGYGTAGQVPPNSLLIFEVKVIDVNVPQGEEDEINLNEIPEEDDEMTFDDLSELDQDDFHQSFEMPMW